MLGSIVTDLEVDALTNVVAKFKIEVCSLTAWCLLWTVLVATSNFNWLCNRKIIKRKMSTMRRTRTTRKQQILRVIQTSWNRPNYKRLSLTVTICIVKPSGLSPYNPGSPWNLEEFPSTHRTTAKIVISLAVVIHKYIQITTFIKYIGVLKVITNQVHR